jgi:predicted transcriptional regulator of viral defense system
MMKHYIDQLRQAGRLSFSREEAQQALGVSKAALGMALARLKKKGEIASPYRDFYISIPPEYRSLGCLPADQLIPPLMKFIGIPYYVCLLSAAAIHGAAHQRPQIFQVMVSKRMRQIECGKIMIQFIFKKNLLGLPTQLFAVPTGYLTLSTPELTAMDLLLYPRQSGGISHIATVFTELIEAINADKLLLLAQSSEESGWIQRLGYLFEQIEPEETANKSQCIALLKDYIQNINPSYIPLVPGKVKGSAWNKAWKVIVNSDVESDI